MIPDEHKLDTIEGLNNIQYLSVREESGQDIIRNLVGREAYRAIDPVFLLDAERWEKLAYQQAEETEPYIFVYPTQITKTLKNFVKKLKKKTNLKVISPFYFPGCKVKKDIGPKEFLSYIRNAEYVVGSSFHGTAFAILFRKKFFVVTHSKTGDRTGSLLRSIGMECCIVRNDINIDNVEWNYEEAGIKLAGFIEGSQNFLRNALEES